MDIDFVTLDSLCCFGPWRVLPSSTSYDQRFIIVGFLAVMDITIFQGLWQELIFYHFFNGDEYCLEYVIVCFCVSLTFLPPFQTSFSLWSPYFWAFLVNSFSLTWVLGSTNTCTWLKYLFFHEAYSEADVHKKIQKIIKKMTLSDIAQTPNFPP
jgi:hypothetical protein